MDAEGDVQAAGDDAKSSPTEARHPLSAGIDSKSALEICKLMHSVDREAWEAVGRATAEIARCVDGIVASFRRSGRLLYVGAGTSGRLGVLDASECPPTFGVDPGLVHGEIAGGDAALRSSIEEAEDSPERGARVVHDFGAESCDFVCGIAVSGRTPFVRGAIEAARTLGSATALITCNPGWQATGWQRVPDLAVVLDVGPEVIAGSSRLKAGTATKMALNMMTTAAMIRWGKVYDNLMVDLTPVNAKLRERAVRLVRTIAGVDDETALRLLKECDWNVKVATVMAQSGLTVGDASHRLREHDGQLRSALEGFA